VNVDPASPEVASVLERAGLLPPSSQTLAQLQAAAASVEADALLEVSRAQWGNEDEGPEDVLVVLVRDQLVLVSMRKGGLFRGAEPSARTVTLADYTYVAEDDEFFGHSVFLLAPNEDATFLISWPDVVERQRMFRAIFEAHAGNYGRWGVQLDPADYIADFDRFLALLTAEGPERGIDLFEWVEREIGDYEIQNALGFALDWRDCELNDAAGRTPSRRVGRLAHPHPWVEAGPEAERLFLRLGEQLFDAGMLAPPYDERSFDLGDEPMTGSDAGPARLLALMTLTSLASRFDHPRTGEWTEAAEAGIPLVPPSVFPADLRHKWSAIGELPVA